MIKTFFVIVGFVLAGIHGAPTKAVRINLFSVPMADAPQGADATQGADAPQCADAPKGADAPQDADAPQGVDTPPRC
jgi:hypothetical protein